MWSTDFKRRLRGGKAALEHLKRQMCFTSSSPVEKMSKEVRNTQVVAAGWMQRFSHLGRKSHDFLSNSLLNHSMAPVSSSVEAQFPVHRAPVRYIKKWLAAGTKGRRSQVAAQSLSYQVVLGSRGISLQSLSESPCKIGHFSFKLWWSPPDRIRWSGTAWCCCSRAHHIYWGNR